MKDETKLAVEKARELVRLDDLANAAEERVNELEQALAEAKADYQKKNAARENYAEYMNS
ncbi:MAG: hypothetical protein IT416_01880 [Candidatus Pacebacteria bacterium]|nr:hypothetical protein [Candidatus Paceibacterota bacterium]